MINEVARDEFNAMFGADDCFELRPTTFEFLLSVDFLAFRRFFELRIGLGALGVFQLEL